MSPGAISAARLRDDALIVAFPMLVLPFRLGSNSALREARGDAWDRPVGCDVFVGLSLEMLWLSLSIYIHILASNDDPNCVLRQALKRSRSF